MRPRFIVDLSASLKIVVEPSATSYIIFLGNHVISRGEMTEHIMEILENNCPELAEKVKRLGPKEKRSAE